MGSLRLSVGNPPSTFCISASFVHFASRASKMLRSLQLHYLLLFWHGNCYVRTQPSWAQGLVYAFPTQLSGD